MQVNFLYHFLKILSFLFFFVRLLFFFFFFHPSLFFHRAHFVVFFQPFLLEPKNKKTRKYLRVRSHSAVNFFFTIIPSAVIPQSKYIVKSYILLYRLIDTKLPQSRSQSSCSPSMFSSAVIRSQKKVIAVQTFLDSCAIFSIAGISGP